MQKNERTGLGTGRCKKQSTIRAVHDSSLTSNLLDTYKSAHFTSEALRATNWPDGQHDYDHVRDLRQREHKVGRDVDSGPAL